MMEPITATQRGASRYMPMFTALTMAHTEPMVANRQVAGHALGVGSLSNS